MPIAIIVPLLIIAPKSIWPDVLMGALLFSVVGGGISDVTLNVSFDKHFKRISFYTTRPVKSIDYMFGIVAGGFAYTIVSALILLFISNVILGFTLTGLKLLYILLTVLLAWFISSNIGFILALYGPKDYRLAGSLSDFLLFTVSFLAPVYYPIGALPIPLQWASYGIYTTHLALILKNIVKGRPFPTFSLLFLVIFALLLFLVSENKMKWKRI
jgi:ABC-2 type transport system permease protein